MTEVPNLLEGYATRQAVTDLLHQVTAAADARDWGTWEQLFVLDAVVDYRGAGGRRGTPPEVRSDLASDFEELDLVRHLVTNVRVDLVDTATASAQALFLSPVRGKPDHPASLVGGRYELQARVVADSWRLTHLSAHLEWWTG